MSSAKPTNGLKVAPKDQPVATRAEVPDEVEHTSNAESDGEPLAGISEGVAMAKTAVKSVEAAAQLGRIHKKNDGN